MTSLLVLQGSLSNGADGRHQVSVRKLTGLIENNPKKGIDNPTIERLLKAFDKISLAIVHLSDQLIRHVTPLTALQPRTLELLGLSSAVYTSLVEI